MLVLSNGATVTLDMDYIIIMLLVSLVKQDIIKSIGFTVFAVE